MISFEKTLINIKKIPDVPLYANVICIINRETNPDKINIPQLVGYLNEINIPSEDNYNEVIHTLRSVILGNQARMCRFLGGIEKKDFNTDNFILLSYINFENKNPNRFLLFFFAKIIQNVKKSMSLGLKQSSPASSRERMIGKISQQKKTFGQQKRMFFLFAKIVRNVQNK